MFTIGSKWALATRSQEPSSASFLPMLVCGACCLLASSLIPPIRQSSLEERVTSPPPTSHTGLIMVRTPVPVINTFFIKDKEALWPDAEKVTWFKLLHLTPEVWHEQVLNYVLTEAEGQRDLLHISVRRIKSFKLGQSFHLRYISIPN